MPQDSQKIAELKAKLSVCKAREEQAINNYNAACRQQDSNPAFKDTLEARQTLDALLRQSRQASSNRGKAETKLEVEYLKIARKQARAKALAREHSNEKSKGRGFRKRGDDIRDR